MRMDTAVAHYNRGNALVMQGEYELAIEAFDRSLELQPGWKNAVENREIARIRAERLDFTGGDMTGGKMEADDIEFDIGVEGGQDPPETTVDEGKALNDEQVQALWLRRVQTEPADFLRARFSYQQAMAERGE